MKLKQTKWWNWAKRNWPKCCHESIIKVSQDKDLVCEIEKWEPGTIGNRSDKVFWAVSVVRPDTYHGLWMYMAKTEQEALDLCKEMNWKLAR